MTPGSPADRAVTLIVALAGVALVTAGAYLVHPAAALIFAGCACLEISIGGVLAPRPQEPPK